MKKFRRGKKKRKKKKIGDKKIESKENETIAAAMCVCAVNSVMSSDPTGNSP
jgi:hypothetical protein